jgi:hypothetical protein
VDENDSTPCPKAGFGVSDVGLSGSVTMVLDDSVTYQLLRFYSVEWTVAG